MPQIAVTCHLTLVRAVTMYPHSTLTTKKVCARSSFMVVVVAMITASRARRLASRNVKVSNKCEGQDCADSLTLPHKKLN